MKNNIAKQFTALKSNTIDCSCMNTIKLERTVMEIRPDGRGKDGTECGGAPDQIITWGDPIVTYRWDNSPDVDIKDFSVREIQATTQSTIK